MVAQNITGVILAGGASNRFGGEIKAKIAVKGIPIISRIIDIMVDIFDELLIVTNTPEEFKEYNKFSIISDQYLNKGPLGGIHSALRKASGDAIFVVAGDMPLLDKYLIIRQLNYFMNNNYKVIIPRVNSLIEPLHGIYSRSILNSLEDLLNSENDYSIRAFLKKINVHYLDFEDSEKTRKAFTNINSPSDLSVIKKLLETDD